MKSVGHSIGIQEFVRHLSKAQESFPDTQPENIARNMNNLERRRAKAKRSKQSRRVNRKRARRH